MAKSRLLYGYGPALNAKGPIIICEDPTDVWRLQTNAVALFGNSLSPFQQEVLAKRFKGRPLVLLLDSDARQDALQIQQRLSDARRRAQAVRQLVAELPEGGKDHSDLAREVVLERVARALGQGCVGKVRKGPF